MKKAITAITFFDTVFLLLLAISGTVGGAFGSVAYYFAFIVPVLLAFLFVKNDKDGEERPVPLKISPDAKSALFSLPLAAPFIALIFAVSLLTSLLLTFVGFTNTSTDVSGNIFLVITRHALLPAFCEEALFRFIPLMLLLPYSKKNALVIPSILFATVHCNLFQIPYALVASFALTFIAIATGSIFPAIAIHFLNNLASILYMRNGSELYFNVFFFSILAILAVASIAFIVIKRERYARILKEIKEDKCNVEFTLFFVLFVAMTLITGVVNLWTSL